MKILLIDDNTSITKALSRLLTLKGHDCAVCDDGRNGLTMISNKKFDAVFLDIAMPEFSGLDVITELDKRDMLKGQHIMVLSASAISEKEMGELSQKGVFACLKKPISSSVLCNVLGEIELQNPVAAHQ